MMKAMRRIAVSAGHRHPAERLKMGEIVWVITDGEDGVELCERRNVMQPDLDFTALRFLHDACPRELA